MRQMRMMRFLFALIHYCHIARYIVALLLQFLMARLCPHLATNPDFSPKMPDFSPALGFKSLGFRA
jgi:hypothetical protein